MPCAHCSRPVLYRWGEGDQAVPLCLACWEIVENIHFKKWLQSAAMLNHAQDQMDFIMPIAPFEGRIPVAEIARAASGSRTNIHITNSNVGVVNTGHLAKIDATIEISKGTEAEEFGARLKDLTNAIVNDAALDDLLKKQMVEVVRAISDQAASKAPSGVVVKALFSSLKQLASDAGVIAGAVEKLHDAWVRLQSVWSGA